MHDESLTVPVTPDCDKLRAIVHRLASEIPIWRQDGTTRDLTVCHYCGVEWGSEHWGTCLWLAAQEALDAH